MIGITKSEFENSLFRQDVVDYYLNMSKEDIEYKFGNIISDMIGFNQNSPHHCYDLFEHTLRTVIDIPTGELSESDIKLLKIAAFLHDVAKPILIRSNQEKINYKECAINSSKMAKEFLTELGYDEEDIKRICFYITHVNDFIYYKDELPLFYEHHAYVKKISANTIAEQMIENAYDFSIVKLNDIQVKAICYALVRDGKFPEYEDENGEEIKYKNIDFQAISCKLIELKREYTPTLKDYKMLLKLSIANYKAQAKKTYQKGKLIATRAEKVRVAAIIEAMIPDAYKLFLDVVDKYQLDSILTSQLIEATKEYNELVAMNRVEQMKEENAKNLMNKFNDMKIRLTMKS